MQLNQSKHKQVPPQFLFATLTSHSHINLVHCLVKPETVIPSQKGDCNPLIAELGNDQFSIRNNDKGGNFINKPLE